MDTREISCLSRAPVNWTVSEDAYIKTQDKKTLLSFTQPLACLKLATIKDL